MDIELVLNQTIFFYIIGFEFEIFMCSIWLLKLALEL